MADDRADLDRTEDDIRGDRAKRVLEELNVEAGAENLEMMKVYLQAFEIFLERNRRHRAQWRVGGLQGLLVDLRKKTERTWNEFMLSATPPTDVDSFVDLINYASFAVQAVKEGLRGQQVGTWTWPKPHGNEGRSVGPLLGDDRPRNLREAFELRGPSGPEIKYDPTRNIQGDH